MWIHFVRKKPLTGQEKLINHMTFVDKLVTVITYNLQPA